ncbi:MAG: histidinol-phosphate aminotransferase [Epulopiscium sp. Nele67-Bin002]|nr:MAG: histidinol-phosphate transaminase [Epulopiscium sp. Nele67-Bin001]OON91815.1 MAG: histidinol-phosphate aminotransferase [Epulopiscium sp. Nele67-Bin002]
MSKYLASRLSNLVAYTPGEQPDKDKYIKLNTNENPYPPAKEVTDVLTEVAPNLHLYCDPACKALTEAFCNYYSINKEETLFANGSDEILALCYMTFCEQSVAFPSISYGFYEVYSDLFCLDAYKIPLTADFRVDKNDYFNLDKTIIIANPNAPTGVTISLSDIEDILNTNKDNVVIIDEAYADFCDVSCKELVKAYDNLVVVGTFSKSRNLAGARLGYAIACEALIEDLKRVKNSFNPYNVNMLTQALGTASIKQDEYFKNCISKVITERNNFIRQLDKLGFSTLTSGANFVFTTHCKFSGEELYNKLRDRKILVRHFNKEPINNFVRITIGTPEQMKQVSKALEEIIL